MKQSLIFMSLLFLSFGALSMPCYSFDMKQPDRLGNFIFGGGYAPGLPAEQICIYESKRGYLASQNSAYLVFNNSRGALARIAITAVQNTQCTGGVPCTVYSTGLGNIGGVNVDTTGTSITLVDSPMYGKSSLTIRVGRSFPEAFSIQNSR